MVSRDEVFDRNRLLLFSMAYRMTGSVMDAEDAVQEAYLRWQRASEDEVRSPSAYLSKVVTRLCIDRLRSARVRREQYVGPLAARAAARRAGQGDCRQGRARRLALDGFTGVAREPHPGRAGCVLAQGGLRLRVRGDSLSRRKERGELSPDLTPRQAIAGRQATPLRKLPAAGGTPDGELPAASIGGDLEALLELLSEDVTLYSDGGGKPRAALRPIYGADSVARFLTGILRNIPPDFAVRLTRVNGRPGLVGYFGDGSPQSVVTLEVAEGSIRTIRLVVNPEKLGSVPPLEQAEREDSR